MIDAHIHLEKGSYCFDWIWEFVRAAEARGVDEIWFLEHTHCFRECGCLYGEMSRFNAYQHDWFQRKQASARPIEEYLRFAERARRECFPVRLRFGLEVCYSPEHEREIANLRQYPLDFLVGSIHFIDGWAFSHKRQPWRLDGAELERLYRRYYGLMLRLARSGLFSGLAHPNSLQCFGASPPGNFDREYDEIALALHEHQMYVEESSGLAVNYGDRELGMNRRMLRAMLKRGVTVLTASDAHIPRDTGSRFREMCALLEETRLACLLTQTSD